MSKVENGVSNGVTERGKWESLPAELNKKALKGHVSRWKITVRRSHPDPHGVSVLEFYVYAASAELAAALIQEGTFRHPQKPLEEPQRIDSWAESFAVTACNEEHQAKLITDLPNLRK